MAPSSRTRDARLIAALAAAKATGVAIRGLGRGGGTAAPGLVAERIDPRLLDKIARRLPQGTVVVAGTNGKTTVSRMLADTLQAHGWRVAHNRSGSNLVRGVASALASQADLTGSPRADIGVIESDEAAFPEIVRRLQPSVVLLNNLFRDQLDRYGELDTIASTWAPALQTAAGGGDRRRQRRRSDAGRDHRGNRRATGHVRSRRSQPEIAPGSNSACRRRQDVPAMRARPCLRSVVQRPPRSVALSGLWRRAPFSRFRGKLDSAGWRRCPASRGLAPMKTPGARFRCS